MQTKQDHRRGDRRFQGLEYLLGIIFGFWLLAAVITITVTELIDQAVQTN